MGKLSNYGLFFHKHFERLGEIEDIDKAISSLEHALQLTPEGQKVRLWGWLVFVSVLLLVVAKDEA